MTSPKTKRKSTREKTKTKSDWLRRVTLVREDRGTWVVTRERDGSGESARCMSIPDCMGFIHALYNADGSPKPDFDTVAARIAKNDALLGHTIVFALEDAYARGLSER